MVLEQEFASIIKYVIDKAGNPSPYYWDIPQNFTVPAAYFPPPEIDTGGETFLTYYTDYAWYIKFFHKTAQAAYSIGYDVAQSLRTDRNLIPLIGENGKEISDSWVRVNDPRLKLLDDGAAQLTITWRNRKPYSNVLDAPERAQAINVDVFVRSGKTITDAYAEALESYLIPLNSGSQPE